MLVFGQDQRPVGRRNLPMKEKRFSVEQIAGVLKQVEVGVPVAELIRKVGISEQTFYRWKKQYVGLESDQVREMKQLQDENSRLKQLVAELSLDKTVLRDLLRRSGEVLLRRFLVNFLRDQYRAGERLSAGFY
jgi:putative transposase